MNHDCEIIQDLMPLVIDEVSNNKSRQAVEEHIKECAYCARVFYDLKTELLRQEEKREEKTDDRFMRKVLKKKYLHRFMRFFFMGVLITVLVYLGIIAVINIANLRVPLNSDEYDIRLVQMNSGDVAAIVDYKNWSGTNQDICVSYDGSVEEKYSFLEPGMDVEKKDEGLRKLVEEGNAIETENGISVLYTKKDVFTAKKYLWGRKTWGSIQNDIKLVYPAWVFNEKCKGYNIYKGEKRIWSLGDPISKASDELEEYYKYLGIFSRFENSMYSELEGGYIFSNEETDRRSRLMQQHLDALKARIPELQPWTGEKEKLLDEETIDWAFYQWE